MKRCLFPILIGALLCGFLCFGVVRGEEKVSRETTNQVTQGKSELKALQKKIKDEEESIQETQKEEKRVLSELDTIEKELSRKRRDLRRYEKTLKEKKKEIKSINEEIDELQRHVARQQTHLGDRIRALYKLSRTSWTKALFCSTSLTGFVKRSAYMGHIIEYNVGVITDYSNKLTLVHEQKQKLEDNEKKLVSLTARTRSTQKRILRHQEEKTTLLTKVKSEKELHLKALEELKQASNHLQALIDKLETGVAREALPIPRSLGEPFSASKGKLAFPVEGEIITHFGEHEDPEFATVSFNKGIEVVAAMGSPIKAVLDGTVIYADWFKGYGNIIIIDHGEGYYTLSGHASELLKERGEQVTVEETIGLVGDSGSLKGANLYFEIRHHGQPLNPLDWLQRDWGAVRQ
jgi:septal ring factor EnvC (AmiA/AmiB activator)